MFGYIWPIALVLVSNTFYQICSKGVPAEVSPFAALTITYGIATLTTMVLYFLTQPDVSILQEFAKLNWAAYVLGVVIVGLEFGWICAYKAGWPVSTGFIVHSAILALILIFVGYFLYGEPFTWNKILGIGICLVGLVFINMR